MAGSWVDAIAEREAQLGVETVARMARIFVEDSKSQLVTIEAAASRQALTAARGAAHDLVTNAASLCFVHLRNAAHEFELACLCNDRGNVLTLAKGLPPLVDMCVLQLRERYPQA